MQSMEEEVSFWEIRGVKISQRKKPPPIQCRAKLALDILKSCRGSDCQTQIRFGSTRDCAA